MKRLYLRASNENDEFVLVIEINDEYIKCLEQRIEWAREFESKDSDFFWMEFSDGGDAYEEGGALGEWLEDCDGWEENRRVVSSRTDIDHEWGEPLRLSFVSIKLDGEGYLHWTALPKHGTNGYETGPINIEELRK